MIKKTFLSSLQRLLLVMFIAVSNAVLAAEVPATTPALTFQYQESGVRPTEKVPFVLTLVCQNDGSFHAERQNVPDGAAAEVVAKKDGVLSADEWQQLQSGLKGLTLLTDPPGALDIGYGTKPVPGWKGSLQFQLDGKNVGATFTSLRPATYPERSTAMNQLVTLVFDVKNLTLDKLGLSVPRPVPPAE